MQRSAKLTNQVTATKATTATFGTLLSAVFIKKEIVFLGDKCIYLHVNRKKAAAAAKNAAKEVGVALPLNWNGILRE